ncbi:hypothetical protein CEXT_698901 [Caerostris extrusa]|uniref:Uncharacterized protein n=1 Tax=Caerostris extrusa TaxID=172846 RepID=A0AAV4TL78_CAEEX|nr:hypothetical protein CEXT_698901 [Caerostris extrusa]
MLRVQVKWISSRVTVLWQGNVRLDLFQGHGWIASAFVREGGSHCSLPNSERCGWWSGWKRERGGRPIVCGWSKRSRRCLRYVTSVDFTANKVLFTKMSNRHFYLAGVFVCVELCNVKSAKSYADSD